MSYDFAVNKINICFIDISTVGVSYSNVKLVIVGRQHFSVFSSNSIDE